MEKEKPLSWRDGHYPWQVLFEMLHDVEEYNGFYYDNPLLGQIYGRSNTDPNKRGSCLPASFEMAVEHLYPIPERLWNHSPNTLQKVGGYSDETNPRSIIGKVRYSGTNSTLGELIIGGIRYPINQPILHDIFRCSPGRMMSVINHSSLGLKIASNLNLDPSICRSGFSKSEKPFDKFSFNSTERRLTMIPIFFSSLTWNNENGVQVLFDMLKKHMLPCSVFNTKDIRTWNIVRSLFQGRTPILTYQFPRPNFKFKPDPIDGFPVVVSYDYGEIYWGLNQKSDEFNPDGWPEMQGHAIVAIGLKMINDELYFLINDPGPALKIDIRDAEFELLHPNDPKLACGSRYWIPESVLLSGRMSIDGLFEISRDFNVVEEDMNIYEISEFRMGRKKKEKPIERVVFL